MPTTESAIDHEKLAALIRDAKEGREVSPSEFTHLLMYDLRDLEGSAKVPIHTAELEPNSQQLQIFMRRCLAVIDALLGMSFSPSHALFWFRCFPLRDFHHKTPVMVLSEENVERVVENLRSVFDADRPGLGDFYECMRRDTLSIQDDVFREVKMLTAKEAARLCGLRIDDMSELDVARAVERTKRAIYIMKGREPVFPAFQFDYAGPKRIIAGIIKTLSPHRTNWEIAVWLWGSNGWLNGASPMDLLDSDPILVLDAAFQDIAEESED